jgi:hypothetical protein
MSDEFLLACNLSNREMDFANGCVERANKQEARGDLCWPYALIYVVRLRREALGAPIVRIVAYALGSVRCVCCA